MATLDARSGRWAGAASVCLFLVVASLLAAAAPAAAVKAPPWRWAKVTQTLLVPARSNSSANLTCPAGYIPVSGGYSAPDSSVYRMLEYPGGNSYTMTLGNSAFTNHTADLVAWCANADDVGPDLVSATDNFPEGTNSRAGGVAVCPSGYGVLSGGVDWFTTGDRRIDFSGPTPLGDGWFATGSSSAVDDTLAIEVRCVPNATLAEQQVVLATSAYISGGSQSTQTATCPAGTRVMTGGSWARAFQTNSFDTTSRGWAWASTQTSTTWTSSASVSGSNFTAIAHCIPADIPVVNYTQLPPPQSTSNSGQFTFTASDPASAPLTITCHLDGSSIPCQPGVANSFGPLSQGQHVLQVVAKNDEGFVGNPMHLWSIDSIPPEVVEMSPVTGAGLAAPFVADFSEFVLGVGAASFRLTAGGSSTPVAATVDHVFGTNHTWALEPAGLLVPGQRYTARLSDAITDPFGNALSPTSWKVRAATQVQNVSGALVETWDTDSSGVASGGGYISSNSAGSSAAARGAGTEISVWGIRGPQGGNATILVDGVDQGTVSFYASTLRRTRVLHLTGLADGPHKVQVLVLGKKPAGSSGTWVGLDSIVVGTTTRQESRMTQRFRRVAASGSSGGSYDVVGHATSGDTAGRPTYRLAFRGTSVRVFATKSPSSGKARVYIDGTLKATVDLRSTTARHNVRVFTSTFADKVHQLRIVPVGTASGARSNVGIDRIRIG